MPIAVCDLVAVGILSDDHADGALASVGIYTSVQYDTNALHACRSGLQGRSDCGLKL